MNSLISDPEVRQCYSRSSGGGGGGGGCTAPGLETKKWEGRGYAVFPVTHYSSEEKLIREWQERGLRRRFQQIISTVASLYTGLILTFTDFV